MVGAYLREVVSMSSFDCSLVSIVLHVSLAYTRNRWDEYSFILKWSSTVLAY